MFQPPFFYTVCWLNNVKPILITMFSGKINMFHQDASDIQPETLENLRGFPQIRGYPTSWMVYFMEDPNLMDDFGVPPWLRTPSSGDIVWTPQYFG